MTKGGTRNRNGAAPDPKSARSARQGLSFDQLPAEGYDGEAPEFPLPPAVVMSEHFEHRKKVTEVDEGETTGRNEREQELWEWAWTTPQAAAWAREPWRWQAVAMWVRISALCEAPEAQAADKSSLHRFADQIGLTPAGLRENGWEIVRDQVQEKRAEKDAESGPASDGKMSARERRLKAVADAQ